MATAIKMPQLGVTMTEAKVVSWLKREGDPVRKGEPVATIETDKLSTEVEATGDGVLRRIVAPEGTVVPVVGLMAVIAAPDEPDASIEALVQAPGASGQRPGARAAAAGAARPPLPVGEGSREGVYSAGGGAAVSTVGGSPLPLGAGVTRAAGAPAAATLVVPEGEVRASPMARRLAADLGVDLARVRGSGPGGRVVEADVRAAAQSAAATDAAPSAAGAATAAAISLRGGVTAPAIGVVAPAPNGGFVLASPLARRLARERGLALGAVPGSGPGGRVVERDVLAAVEASAAAAALALAAAPAEEPARLTRRETIRLDGMRRLIAERMHHSLQSSAQLTITTEADATTLVELRGHLAPAARVYGHRPPTYTDLLVYLVARALRDHPRLNSSLVDAAPHQPEIACWAEINVGVAVALERGLVVPVIRHADQKPLQAISQELGDAAERARDNRLTVDDLQGGTFTITNLGQMEVDTFTPIVNPPQCAILGVGRIARKPAVHGDQVAIRHLVSLSLSFDHRIVDGAPAGAFLRDVKRAIEAAVLSPTPGPERVEGRG